MPDNLVVPYHAASVGQEEIDAVCEVLSSGWLTTGPKALEFERDFAAYVGAKHAVAVNSCTAALQLAMDAIGLKPGEEVLVPTYTFTATAEVVTYFGARPVLCDVAPGEFNIDPSDAESRVTNRSRALVPVHVAGLPCDLDELSAVAEREGLVIVEDAAHALPSDYKGKRIGSISPITTFSFYATKTITTGEGGMLTTDDDTVARRARMMRLHGISGDAWKRYSKEGSWYYEVVEAGYKLNLADILAALGLVQLRKADEFRARRARIASRYCESLAHLEELEMPPHACDQSTHAWHLFILRIRPELLNIDRGEFIAELKALGVGTSVHFIPLHLQPFYQQRYGYKRGDFPNAEDAYSRCISLPIFPDMSDMQIDHIITSVSKVVERSRKTIVRAIPA